MSGEPLILLPGMMCDERLFAPQMDVLGDDRDVLVPRLDQLTIEGMARHVLDMAPDRPLAVAGLSMGGIVAMAMAGLAPERVARLALLDTNHHADAPERFDIRNRQIEDVRAGRLRQVIVEEMKPVYLAEENRSNQPLLDLLVDMALDVGAEAFIAQSLALRDRPDQTDILRGYAGPTLILCGEEDRLCPPERHREMATLLQNAELVMVPRAGHISTLEQPDKVTSALQSWLG
ncbi:MAG: alpha/beta fold hydrolase [Rhizobiaceae bacterium]